jgi:hypothetical protein
MADHIIRADEITVGTEFIIHSSVADDLADHYLTAIGVETSADGRNVTLDVLPRYGTPRTLTINATVCATIYGGAR